jgi:hypothetical protein
VKSPLVLFAVGIFFLPIAPVFGAYYEIGDQAKALAAAKEKKLPVAWVCSYAELMTDGAPTPNGSADLSQMAMESLKGHAVVIFVDGHYMYRVPNIVHRELMTHDEDNLPHFGEWILPKIVFTDPQVTKILVTVAHSQLRDGRDAPIIRP